MYRQGFTLIELLVVISIIGILASITLVAIGDAKSKGSDAGIKADLNAVRVEAERYYYFVGNMSFDTGSTNATGIADGNGCGTTGMWTNQTIKQAIVDAAAEGGVGKLNNTPSRTVYCRSNASSWVVAVILKSDTNSVWCADSLGKVKQTSRASFDLPPLGASLAAGNCQ